jgi:hypothetical protein
MEGTPVDPISGEIYLVLSVTASTAGVPASAINPLPTLERAPGRAVAAAWADPTLITSAAAARALGWPAAAVGYISSGSGAAGAWSALTPPAPATVGP